MLAVDLSEALYHRMKIKSMKVGVDGPLYTENIELAQKQWWAVINTNS